MATAEYYQRNKEHIKKQVATWQSKNLEKVREYQKKHAENNKETILERHRQRRKRDPLKNLYTIAKTRAKKRGLEFSIDLEDLFLPEFCPYLGFKLDHTSPDIELHYSIDRIDNSKGYIKGNVEVISQRANRLKNNATGEELILIGLRMLGDIK